MSFLIKIKYLFVMLTRTFIEWKKYHLHADLDAPWCCDGNDESNICGCGGVTNREMMRRYR